VSDVDKPINRILESYESAVASKDVEAFMRLYDPGVRVFDAWGVWSYEGSAAWQRAIEGWFTSLGTERVKVRYALMKCKPQLAANSLWSARSSRMRACPPRASNYALCRIESPGYFALLGTCCGSFMNTRRRQ
jgi:ketosteroid isomerase-like protein